MTITYDDKFHTLLFRWKGSVWKIVWKQLVVWLALWFSIRVGLMTVTGDKPLENKVAEEVINLFATFCNNLQIVFILGFYVGQVVTRWWNQVLSISWPDDCMAFANAALHGDPDARAKRESVARWLVLSEAMVFRQISSKVYKRFPQLDHLVDAGLATKEEMEILKECRCKNTQWQMPLEWVLERAVSPGGNLMLCSTLNNFRKDLRNLFTYDWIGIPLVYTQTVAVVVYGYFAYALIGHQNLGKAVDLYIPWLSILQFLFYVGWFNVARGLMRPFGDGEEDIELNCILDRHAATAYSLATDVRETAADFLMDERQREEMGRKMLNNLTYSVAATKDTQRPPKFTAGVKVKEKDAKQVERAQCKQEARCCGLLKSNTPRNFF